MNVFLKKYVRDMQNPIDYYKYKEFLNRFRLVYFIKIKSIIIVIINNKIIYQFNVFSYNAMHNNTMNASYVIQCLMPLIFNGTNAENTKRGLPVPPLIKLLAVLRFYGTGNFQVR